MRTTFDARLVDPSATEPGLLLDLRDERRALMFDLGEISALAPRHLLRVSHVFVTHAHMDHFCGFDHLLALGLGRVPRLHLWGEPGFVERVHHRLQAYTWNVVHRYEVPLELVAHACEADGTRRHARFHSRTSFVREDLPTEQAADPGLLLDEPLFRVRAALVDHEMPVLAYLVEEKAQVRVASDRIRAQGLGTGAWLRTLKQAVLRGAPDGTLIDLAWHDGRGEHRAQRPLGELRALVLDTVPGRRIGYVTDLCGTEANARVLEQLLAPVDLLCIEAVFLDADRAHALRKNHLTARQAGEMARRLQARQVVPFHFSPRYRGREHELRAEVEAARRETGPSTLLP